MSDSLQPHGLQHARLPSPSPTPGVYPNSSPLNRWCHPTISSSVIPCSSCLQSFPASGSSQMSQLFAWGGLSAGVSALASLLPKNTQNWSPLGWTGWIALQSKGLLSLLQHHSSKASILQCWAFFIVQLSHPYMTTGITLALTRWTFVGKVTASEVAKIWRPIWKSLWNDLHHSADGSVCVLYSWNGRNAKDQNALLTLRLRTQILDSDSLLPNYCSRNFFITLGKTFKMS